MTPEEAALAEHLTAVFRTRPTMQVEVRMERTRCCMLLPDDSHGVASSTIAWGRSPATSRAS
jgi:hypothetical protein